MSKMVQRTAKQPRASTSPIRRLLTRLNKVGFDESFVRRYILPEWWDDELSANPASFAVAEVALARILGFSVADLRNPEAPLALAPNEQIRFKRSKNSRIEEMLPAVHLAQSIAKLLVGVMGAGLPAYQQGSTARSVREAILEKHPSVNLAGLLEWAWGHGIVVMHLARWPKGAKKFCGIAMQCGDVPVIVLGSGRDAPPWLAFHLAHEISHVLAGHVQSNQKVLDADIEWNPTLDQSLKNDPVNINPEETIANELAMQILTGDPSLEFAPEYGLTGGKLAEVARRAEQEHQIDSGTFALIYGYTAGRMPAAQLALKHLGLITGAQHQIAEALRRQLPEALPESLMTALPLISLENPLPHNHNGLA